MSVTALDLFAGTGWGVACQALGIDEYGVEIMPEAVATRQANGMHTIYGDVWEGLEGSHTVPPHALLIASPPCQTFSMAGSGKGREALDEVLGLIDSRAYLDVRKLREFGERHDMRTALVLTPLAHVARDVPPYVIFEQVPTVLPVWERCAEEMRKWGYSVWVGILNSEQYGVPQTRKRAILIARADGKEAKPPTPTHSRYYSRDPKRLDPGVLPWVSMAEALGWGMTARPHMTVTGGGASTGGAEPFGRGAREGIMREYDAGRWVDGNVALAPDPEGEERPVGVYFHPMSYGRRGVWPIDEPAPTIRGVQRPMPDNYQPHPRDAHVNPDIEGAPEDWLYAGAGRTAVDTAGQRQRPLDEPAHTMTGASTAVLVANSGNRVWEERPVSSAPVKVTVAQAAALQSYPACFEWDVTMPGGKPIAKGKQFLQIGNAVPPLLAEAILREVLS